MDNTSQLLTQAYIEAYLQESQRLIRLIYGSGGGVFPAPAAVPGPQFTTNPLCLPPPSYSTSNYPLPSLSSLNGCCVTNHLHQPTQFSRLPESSLPFTPTYAPTPTVFETPAPTPVPITQSLQATCASTTERNRVVEEEEENARPVIVQACSCRATTKARRNEMIKFNKHLKAVHGTGRVKRLPCWWCAEVVDNDVSSIRSHVHGHSTTPLYCCRLCEAGFKEQRDIFDHVIQCRKRRAEGPASPSIEADSMCCSIDDRRNMPKLISTLVGCFPRASTVTKRKREEYTRLVDELLRQASEVNTSELTCQMCGMTVTAQRTSLTEHLHPPHTVANEAEAAARRTNSDEPDSPSSAKASRTENGTRTHKCTPPEVLASWLRVCFYDHYLASNTA